MSNQKHITDAIDFILDAIEGLEGHKKPTSEVVKQKVKSQNLKLYEVNFSQKTYILASDLGEAAKGVDALTKIGGVAGVTTQSDVQQVLSKNQVSTLVDMDKPPLVPVISDFPGRAISPSLFTLNELVPHLFPDKNKEKEEVEKKLEEATAKYKAAQDEYHRLWDQVQGTK
jgi:hypothetical protein